MKSLKQIREEYNDNIMHLVNESDDILLEAKKDKDSMIQNVVPSFKEMPMMLLFRRVSYRIYPHKQVVALYYSSMLNKYLSIPFGPGGNLNLSEAVIIDEDQLDEIAPLIAGAIEGAAAYGASKLLPKAVELGKKVISKFRSKSKKPATPKTTPKKSGSGALDAAAAAAGAAAGSAAGSKGSNIAVSGGDRVSPVSTAHLRSTDVGKTSSSWEKKAGSDTARQAKERIAHDKQLGIKENKISDIRAMINSGETIHEMNINGKTITLNNTMAKRILEVYDSVNTKNKKIVEGMLNEDLESFKKLLTFSIRN